MKTLFNLVVAMIASMFCAYTCDMNKGEFALCFLLFMVHVDTTAILERKNK